MGNINNEIALILVEIKFLIAKCDYYAIGISLSKQIMFYLDNKTAKTSWLYDAFTSNIFFLNLKFSIMIWKMGLNIVNDFDTAILFYFKFIFTDSNIYRSIKIRIPISHTFWPTNINLSWWKRVPINCLEFDCLINFRNVSHHLVDPS